MSTVKLFAVYLGGQAERCHTELHDVVFAIGETIEETYPQLCAQWFGVRKGLHIDSWRVLDVVDGYQITLVKTPQSESRPGAPRLFFINLGAYPPGGDFTELHRNVFLVGPDAATVKQRAKTAWRQNVELAHTDALHAVDECLPSNLTPVYSIRLTPTNAPESYEVHDEYHPIP